MDKVVYFEIPTDDVESKLFYVTEARLKALGKE
jgi:hypothetical protein